MRLKIKIVNILKASWNGFNYWRKRYWPLRVIILTALAIPFLFENYLLFGEPVINRLVRISCQSMQYRSQPRVINAWLHYNRSLEKQRLLLNLKAIENKLSAQERQELNNKPSKADLKQLFTLARKHGILPESAELNKMKHAMLASAIYETKLRFDPEYQKIDRIIDSCKHPDYTSWNSWENGINVFFYYLKVTIFPNPWETTFSWLLFCFFSGVIMNALVPRFKQTCGIILATGVTYMMIRMSQQSVSMLNGNELTTWFWYMLKDNYSVPSTIYHISLAAAVALFGCRLFDKINRKLTPELKSIIAYAGFGVALICIGVNMCNQEIPRYISVGNTNLSLMIFQKKYLYMENIFYSIGFTALAWALSLTYSLYKSKQKGRGTKEEPRPGIV